MNTPTQTVLEKRYTDGRAVTDVEIAVVNPSNYQQVVLRKKVQIDTGFDSGAHIRESEVGDLVTIGVKPSIGTVTLAGNVSAKAQYCLGYLQKIGDHTFPAPGIEITLVFQGTTPQGLLGLEAISKWMVMFDGPAQVFKITC